MKLPISWLKDFIDLDGLTDCAEIRMRSIGNNQYILSAVNNVDKNGLSIIDQGQLL